MSDLVLDSSAVLAYLRQETGGDAVGPMFDIAAITTVNVAEVLGRLLAIGYALEDAKRTVDVLSMRHIPFDEGLALDTAALSPSTRRLGLSLGDRACLALARREGLPVLTCDRAWASLDVGVDIRMIR